MKYAFQSILMLTVAGLLALIFAALYFGAPLFGWFIMLAIMAVFFIIQIQILKILKKLSYENLELESLEKGKILQGDGAVFKRVQLAKELLSKKIRLDSQMAYEVLSNNVGVEIPRSAGGTVILLGLMGTFFGLMYSVATAGGAIDNSTTQGTLDTIQLLFRNMKGIFGTSLCGLFAALILNISRSLIMQSRDNFVARLDAYTLKLQGEMDGENSEEETKSELERLFNSVEKNLSEVAESVKAGLYGVVDLMGQKLAEASENMNLKISKSVENLGDSVEKSLGESMEKISVAAEKLDKNVSVAVENLGSTVSSSFVGAFAPITENVKSLAKSIEIVPQNLEERLKDLALSVENIATKVDENLEGISKNLKESLESVSNSVKSGLSQVAYSTENAMGTSTENIAKAVEIQVEKSASQWNEFMNKLAEESEISVRSQKEGLDTLKNVALQVAEKAQVGSVELSESVSQKLSALSTDILEAFQKLSDTSVVLLEAQKNLTESIDNRVVKEKEATDALGANIVETAELMRVNQSELSANLEMLRAGLETILEKLSGDTAEREEEEGFIEHLNQSLEAFHERASEMLLENAVKTQEILLEVLEQTQRKPKVEG